jgi:hypothetical protein
LYSIPHSAFRIRLFGIRRGLALVELLALGGVLGLALGLMAETGRAAREMLRFEGAMQYCQQAMDETVRLVRAAVPPASLQGTAAPSLLAPRYTRRELALIVAEGGGFSRVTLDSVDNEKNQAALRRRTLALAGASATTRTEELSRIPRPERFEPGIRFAYAAPPTPGQPVSYQDEWTSATPPALVRITIQALVGNGEANSSPIELQTAVIPGLIPAGAAVQEAKLAAPPAEPEARPKTSARHGKPLASSKHKKASASTARQTKASASAAGKKKTSKVITAEPSAKTIKRTRHKRIKGGTEE